MIAPAEKLKLEFDKCYFMDCIKGMYSLPKHSIKLLIIDPPYYKIKGAFDWAFETRAEWCEFLKELARAVDHVLHPYGSFFLYGHAKNIAYQQIIFDELFELENSLIWEKIDAQTRKNRPEDQRSFKPVTERILFYARQRWNNNALNYYEGFEPLRLWIKSEIDQIKENTKYDSINKIGTLLGVSGRMIGHYTSRSQWELPNEARYKQLQQTGYFKRSFADLRTEYDKIHKKYAKHRDETRRHFDLYLNLTDVLKFSQETHLTGPYGHPTPKPPKLTRALILTASKPGDRMCVPFSGSGVEVEQAAIEGRPVIGFDNGIREKDGRKWSDIGNERIDGAKRKRARFTRLF